MAVVDINNTIIPNDILKTDLDSSISDNLTEDLILEENYLVDVEVLSKIEINKPVKILKKIDFNVDEDFNVNLPKHSKLKVYSLNNNNRELLDKKVDLIVTQDNQELVVSEVVVNDEVYLLKNSNKTELELEYELEGPGIIEEDIISGKRLTIYSEYHFKNVNAYTDIKNTPKDSIRLYWLKETGKELF